MTCLLSWLQIENYYKVSNIIVEKNRIRFTSRNQLQLVFSCSYSPVFDAKDEEILVLDKNLNEEITQNIHNPRRVYRISYTKKQDYNLQGFQVIINLVDKYFSCKYEDEI